MGWEEVFKMTLANLPYAAIFLYMLKVIYDDWKADREVSRKERIATIQLMADVKNRLEDIEIFLTGKRSETQSKRPPELDLLIESLNPQK